MGYDINLRILMQEIRPLHGKASKIFPPLITWDTIIFERID